MNTADGVGGQGFRVLCKMTKLRRGAPSEHGKTKRVDQRGQEAAVLERSVRIGQRRWRSSPALGGRGGGSVYAGKRELRAENLWCAIGKFHVSHNQPTKP